MWRLVSAHSELDVAFEPLSSSAPRLDGVRAAKQPLQYMGPGKWAARHGGFRFINLRKLSPKLVVATRRDRADTVYSYVVRNGMAISKPSVRRVARWHDAGYGYLSEYCESEGVPLLDVCFERLCGCPEKVMRSVFQFLGATWEGRVMNAWKQRAAPFGNTIGDYNMERIELPDHSGDDRRAKFDSVYDSIEMEG